MCAIWVGFLSLFFVGGRKKQNKFGSADLHFVPIPSNLHCPVKKINPFFLKLSLSYLCAVSDFLHLLVTVGTCCRGGFRRAFLSGRTERRCENPRLAHHRPRSEICTLLTQRFYAFFFVAISLVGSSKSHQIIFLSS